jgi:tyrosine-protein kinase Etk/Wzc
LRPINILDALDFLWNHARRIGLWAVALGVVGYALSFIVPATYRSSVVILPPEEDELSASLSLPRSTLLGLSPLTRLGSTFTQTDIDLAILHSRSVRERIAGQFDLQHVYRVKSLDAASKGLGKHCRIRLATDGTISVAVEDRDPRRAAALANQFIAELDLYNQKHRSFRGRRTRMFLERRVAEVDSTLHATEQHLALYQRKQGTVVAPAETRGSLDAATSLMAQKTTAEVELELMREYASEKSEQFQRLQARVRELRKQVGALPTAQVGAAELLRQVAVQEEVFALLTSQLEQARIREAMDTPTVQVLDPAKPPEKPFWPRHSWIAVFGLLLGVVIGTSDAAGKLSRLPRRG